MPAMNVLANLFVTIYNTEARRKGECVVLPTSKIGTNVLETLKKDGYIKDCLLYTSPSPRDPE